MRILFFSDSFGNSTFIYNQVKEVARYHNVLYLCTNRQNQKIFPFENVRVIQFQYSRFMQSIKGRLELYDLQLNFRNRFFRKRIEVEIDKFKPDIIHLQFGYEALKLLDNSYNINYRYIISFRGFDASRMLNYRSYRLALENYLCKENVFCTFVCNYLRENLRKYEIPVDKSEIIYSNTDTEFFKRENNSYPENGPFVFLQVSSFREKKGHVYTLRAFKQLIDRNPRQQFELGFTGKRNDMYHEVEKEVSSLGLETNVKFLGWTSPKETKEYLGKCNCVILHSVTARNGDQEGIPNALMEAMAMELPVISTVHAGIPELVKHGINGFLVKERDINGYSKYMEKVTKWGLKKNNRDVIIRNFSVEKHITKLNSFYNYCFNNYKI